MCKKSREKVRAISDNPVVSFQITPLMDRLESDAGDMNALKEQVLLVAKPYMAPIAILTSMRG